MARAKAWPGLESEAFLGPQEPRAAHRGRAGAGVGGLTGEDCHPETVAQGGA